MQGKIRILLSVVLLLIISISCNALPAASATTTPEHSINWWTSWLNNPVCSPPCWHNITPGLTTMDEAISILENTPDLIITFKSDDGIDWVFRQNEDEGGTLSTSPNGIVAWLVNTSDGTLHLETIIAFHNYPKYVKPYDCRDGMCSTALIYPDLGMFLSVFLQNKGVDNDSPRLEILSNTIVDRVYFIEPGEESFLNLYHFSESELLMDWKGYGHYP